MMIKEFQIPDRKYADGPKKMVSWRLPERLMEELDRTAKYKGWSTTDLIVTVLDQYIQFTEKESLEDINE